MTVQEQKASAGSRNESRESRRKILKYLFPELTILGLMKERMSDKLQASSQPVQNTNEQWNPSYQQPQYNQSMQYQNQTDYQNSFSYEDEDTRMIDEELLENALKKLDGIVGLKEVKEFIYDLKDEVYLNIQRELAGQKTSKSTLHMVFTGNPGTGKTTVARIVADIFKALGVVSNGHLVEVVREDLVGSYVGQTAPKTREIIEQSIGGILFIDEAYTLSRGGETDFGKEAIDALVKGMEENRENMVVILAGYSKEMYEFMQANSGLKSRFPNQIEFKDYTSDELLKIAQIEVKKNDFIVDEKTLKVIHGILEQRQIPGRNDSGNGRLVRNIMEEARRKQSKRLVRDGYQSAEEMRILLPEDFGYVEEETFDLEKELGKIIGNEKVKVFIRQLAAQIKVQKLRKEKGLSGTTGQTLHMIFSGNPGTGKTTIARIIGKMLKDMGVLKSGHLIETDRSGLVAGHVGQTAEKTNDIISQALGGILFIDEAYALASGGANDFGREAIDTLVKGMEDHRENLLVILAGYEEDMEKFLQVNAGLRSRFPNQFVFEDYSLKELMGIAKIILKSKGYKLTKDSLSALENALKPAVGVKEAGNGRFVRNLIEQVERNQNLRISQLENPSDTELILLVREDFEGED